MRRMPLIRLCLGVLLAVLAPTQALAWNARGASAPSKPHRTSGSATTGKPKSPQRAPATAPLHERVDAVLRARRIVPVAALRLLKEAVGTQAMAQAIRLATALTQAPGVPAGVLLDAATALSAAENSAWKLALWRRAWTAVRGGQAQARIAAEGYADALMAAGETDDAGAILQTALSRTPRGQRRSLFDRLVALGRVGGDLTVTLEQLQAWVDPDAALLAAQLHGELGDDDASLVAMREAWKAFPGHRGLQAAYTTVLVRTGAREELATVVAQVVRLAPADPLPWLAVVDAHIAARDGDKARALIDDLARRYPSNDNLLEALIDREQRLGETGDRLQRLYGALLKAAPREAQYAEAYAEWLLGQGQVGKAREVLQGLKRAPGGDMAALQREADLLLAHGKFTETRSVIEQMQRLRPGAPEALRLLAMLEDRVGRGTEAAARWRELAVLTDAPTPAERSRAQEARQALAALYRRAASTAQYTRKLADQLTKAPGPLGDVLLYLELYGQLEGMTARDQEPAWLALNPLLRQAFPRDPEVLMAIATGLQLSGRTAEALVVLEALARVDADVAEPLLATVAERALAIGDKAMAAKAETLLLREGGSEPPGPSVLLKLGDVHLRHGDGEGAAALFRRASQASRNDTRATARLATLFRLAGAEADEERALRDIVMRATDAEELESAGQRLLTLALAAGRSGDLVRWLDAAMPQHARRDMLERFRIAAYDAWLRTAALDRQFGRQETAPAPSPVGDALASGDLALQVRALRQLAVLGRPVPPAVALALLHSTSAVLRRDTALAIAAAGVEAGARALVDVMSEGTDQDEDVLRAELAALLVLPHVSGVEAVVQSLLGRGDASLTAALVAGHVGAVAATADLLAMGPRREAWPVALMGLGLLLGHQHDQRQMSGRVAAPLEAQVLAALLEASPLASTAPSPADFLKPAAALWAMAAASHASTRAELVRVALVSDSRSLQAMAMALLAAPQPPSLIAPKIAVGDREGLLDLRGRLVRGTLAPWLASHGDGERAALQRLDVELATRLEQFPADGDVGGASNWCRRWQDRLTPASRLATLCGRIAGP